MAIESAVMALGFQIFWPELLFIDRVGLAFILCVLTGMLISRLQGAGEQLGAIDYERVDTSTTPDFNLASVVVDLMLTVLNAVWW